MYSGEAQMLEIVLGFVLVLVAFGAFAITLALAFDE